MMLRKPTREAWCGGIPTPKEPRTTLPLLMPINIQHAAHSRVIVDGAAADIETSREKGQRMPLPSCATVRITAAYGQASRLRFREQPHAA